ncbi:MAG TPA: flagellar basal body P-ring protein FlgI [Syntrophales bacterium]|nr:flagellar basal body P-ring protein FlgI [Syntrophales bacterium]HPC00565.1 flagellar basal body P-ring protein FlgI [Syntrophales bacterium]HRS86556.1 flagellar basal body P-ring protein FlgI [Syntrophales bacterium]
MRRTHLTVVIAILILALGAPVQAARIKDIAGIGGVRSNQLVGYGLTVGLMGTGDDVKNGYTRETIANMLSRQGLSMRDRIANVKAKNTAAVMVTANLPPFAKNGTRIDCTVSSLGDATSLQGGTLIMTPLRGPDGEIYAVCQGPVLLGGFSAGGANAAVTKNQTNVGIVVNGALVEKEVVTDFAQSPTFTVNLYNPDFTTVRHMAARLNALMGAQISAFPKDSGTVVVRVKEAYLPHIMEIVAEMENVDIPVAIPAVVVMNEKTGTVVMGENVRISTVAVAHGNLSITIKENLQVSQPLPFAPRPPEQGAGAIRDEKSGTVVAPGGQTVVTKDTTVKVQEEKRQLMVLPQGVTIQEVVQSLNAIGVSPRDLITILQTIKAAGALQAELRVI